MGYGVRSAQMRERWADPAWRARQIALIARRRNSINKQKGNLRYVTTGLDPEMLEAVRKLAIKQNTSMPEVIRTFIQWGLDIEEEYEQTTP